MQIRFLHILLLSLAAMSAGCSQSGHGTSKDYIPTEEINRLSSIIRDAEVYSARKMSVIDSLKRVAESCDGIERWETLTEISSRFRQMNADSAIFYAGEASLALPPDAPESVRIKDKLTYVNALSTSGIFPRALNMLDAIADSLPSIELKIEFWKSERILYSYMLAFVENEGNHADEFKKKYIACDDSLLNHLPKSDPFYRFIYSERLVSDGRWDEATRSLSSLLDATPKDDNLYGMAAFQLAEVYRQKGDFRNYTRHLALSSESDILAGVREGVALPTLANWLYKYGDIDNAFNFINFALDEANTGNVRMRIVTISSLMPIIDLAYRKKIDNSKDIVQGYLVVTSVLLLIAAVLSGGLIMTIRRKKANERRLADSSRTLEAYVGNFIGLCSNYATRLDQLAKLVTRKLASGQTAELQKLVSSGRFSEDDNDDFYKLIDKAILDIFPDFVDNINSLLSPDSRIELRPGETLTPELRIYAFIRLGVDQSSRIAQILHYSVNTVYSYRNRMRNKAVDRENFDADVRNLGRNDTFLSSLVAD